MMDRSLQRSAQVDDDDRPSAQRSDTPHCSTCSGRSPFVSSRFSREQTSGSRSDSTDVPGVERSREHHLYQRDTERPIHEYPENLPPSKDLPDFERNSSS